VDGSGLTRYNWMSPRHVVDVLEGISEQPVFPVLEETLSIAGVDGTLRSRLFGTEAAGNLKGTLGTLTDVSTLSGFVTTKGGERLAFSIMVNGYATDAALPDDVLEEVAEILAAYE
jgi:PBP4 family serine-type D-alanyl-D-alanine carboxypeptidase